MMFRLKIIISCILLTFVQQTVIAQGMQFEEGNWKSVVQKAKEQRKAIFVDVYTTWCGPCKIMAAKVFPQNIVGKVYNQHYINVKIDAEKGEGIEIAKKYNVHSYPTYLFIDPNTEALVDQKGGSMPIDDFIEIGNEVWAKYTGVPEVSLSQMKSQFEAKENISAEFVERYINKLKKEKKSYPKELEYYLDNYVIENYSDDHLYFLGSRFAQGHRRVMEYIIQNYDKVDRILRNRDGIVAANLDRDLNYDLRRKLGMDVTNSKLTKEESLTVLEQDYAILRKINEPVIAEKLVLTSQRQFFRRLDEPTKELAAYTELIRKYILPDEHTAYINKEFLILDKNHPSTERAVDSIFAANAIRGYADDLLKLDSSPESLLLALQLINKSQQLTPQTKYYNNINNMLLYNFGDQKKAIATQKSVVKKMSKNKDPYLKDGIDLLKRMQAKELNLKFVPYNKN